MNIKFRKSQQLESPQKKRKNLSICVCDMQPNICNKQLIAEIYHRRAYIALVDALEACGSTCHIYIYLTSK